MDYTINGYCAAAGIILRHEDRLRVGSIASALTAINKLPAVYGKVHRVYSYGGKPHTLNYKVRAYKAEYIAQAIVGLPFTK